MSSPISSTGSSTHPATHARDELLRLPDHVLRAKVFTYFGFKDYALTGCASTYLQAQWMKQKVLGSSLSTSTPQNI